jgi:hypothetical protein
LPAVNAKRTYSLTEKVVAGGERLLAIRWLSHEEALKELE